MFSIARLGTVLSPARRSDHGFTLIELMVAVGMLGVALVAMSVMFTLSFATARDAQNRLEAKAEAQRLVERLRTLPYFIAFSDQIPGSDPDILDRYFVNSTDSQPGVVRTIDSVSTTGYYTGNVSTTCSKTVSPPECAYVSTFETSTPPTGRLTLLLRFIREPTESGSPITDTQVVPAPSDFDSNASIRDTPPSKLALATVQIDWTEAGRPLSYTVDSILYGTRTIPQKASGLATSGGGKVTGPKFQDGAVVSDIIATLGLTTAETSESDINLAVAKGTILDVHQLDTVTGLDLGPNSFLLRPNGTASDSRTTQGTSSTSVVYGSPGQALFSVDGAGALIGGIGSGSAGVRTSFPILPSHAGIGQPESLATQTVTDLKLYYRPSILSVEGLTVQNIYSTSTVESSTTQIRATSATELVGIRIYGTHDYDIHPDYEGVIKIGRIYVSTAVTSDGMFATAVLNWQWEDFFIWDPDPLVDKYVKADGITAPTCKFQQAPDYPNCTNLQIPLAYGAPDVALGETYESCSACSLAITVGASHRLTSPEGQLAQASQRGLLNFYLKKQGARPLETTIFTLGSANAEVTYRGHGH